MLAGLLAGALVACFFWTTSAEARSSRRRLSALLDHPLLDDPPVGSRRILARVWRADSSEAADALVPSALDVLAACLYSGAPIEQALLAVAGAFGGEVGGLLGGVGRRCALGAPPETAWEPALSDPRWCNAARSIVRAHYSGAPLTEVLIRTADERRRELRAEAHTAANRASVRAVLPLGVCFLPAFVLVGIVPVIAGFAGTLWG
jgi:pilus assembly protein TadC